jgi:trehalose 2-sulfotransferase
MTEPAQSYVICCTPRSGSHLLGGGLDDTGIAGRPKERFPRFAESSPALTSVELDQAVTIPPAGAPYDRVEDAKYIREIKALGTTPNGVFGINIHWFQLNDAMQRLGAYVDSSAGSAPDVLSAAFPNLKYIWLSRRDKVAQAVSWYKSIHTGQYVKLHDSNSSRSGKIDLDFDYNKIKTYFTALRSFDNGWKNYFITNGLSPMVVIYEDLVSNYRENMLSVLEFLGLDPGGLSISESRYEKIADEQSVKWIEMFGDIYSRRLPHAPDANGDFNG